MSHLSLGSVKSSGGALAKRSARLSVGEGIDPIVGSFGPIGKAYWALAIETRRWAMS